MPISLASNEKIYIYGGNGLVASKEGNDITYYNQDFLGSNKIVTNEDGDIISKSVQYPFGEDYSEKGSKEGLDNNYKFTGQEEDEDLYYYGARYYDPLIKRFISVDPVFSSSVSPYAYVGNNPLKYVDPSGREEDIFNKRFEFSVPDQLAVEGVEDIIHTVPESAAESDGTNYNDVSLYAGRFLPFEKLSYKPLSDDLVDRILKGYPKSKQREVINMIPKLAEIDPFYLKDPRPWIKAGYRHVGLPVVEIETYKAYKGVYDRLVNELGVVSIITGAARTDEMQRRIRSQQMKKHGLTFASDPGSSLHEVINRRGGGPVRALDVTFYGVNGLIPFQSMKSRIFNVFRQEGFKVLVEGKGTELERYHMSYYGKK